ncbi:MAG: hypothetical protein Q8N42_01330, partial [bacterium]|nr:hypothetical protein [bacterium]
MRLKKLELTGFKSFAKKTALELPAAISAIVGPNGSGKSNVVEGVQWALGEQALKTLRGKKSEDFIFNGSTTVPRLGKASVTLFFDPEEKSREFGYDEIIITRRVYRDGVNEYLINNSQVRLKDVIELLSKFGLGTSSHHIISQGESDRILSAPSKERREMLEDALGLKIYQLKRQEAERKLKRTGDNNNQVESLRKEIQPHLKFLKKQAEKVEKALTLKEKLKELAREYFSKEQNFLDKESGRLAAANDKPRSELGELENKIEKLKAKLSGEEKAPAALGEFAEMEKDLEEARLKRFAFERDLGRCEGMIELQETRQKEAGKEAIERTLVENFLEKINLYLKEGFLKSVFEKIGKAVAEFSEEIKLHKKSVLASELENLKKKKDELASSLEAVRKEEADIAAKLARIRLETEKKAQFKRDAERELYNAEIRAGNIRNHLKSFEIEEERLKRRKEEVEAEKQSAMHFIGEEISFGDLPAGQAGIAGELTPGERDEMRKEIERLKIRLEDSEGVGDEVLKEYNQVKTRDDFFAKELEDLSKATASLVDLMKELGEKIDNDFQYGVENINKEFQNFFTAMFGGGTAELKIVKIEKRKLTEDEENLSSLSEITEEEGKPAEGSAEMGIEISVNIPRKRIRSLEMLSGGERALTSIALLFAMTQVNPPPFLVLDETDAALDEANSQNYAKMLKD